MSLNSADVDVSQAVSNRWNDAGLDSFVPGSLRSDRLVGIATRADVEDGGAELGSLYAKLECKQGPQPNIRDTSRDYIDFREVTITLYGNGKQVTGAIVGRIKHEMETVPLSIPNASFMRVEPLPDTINEADQQRAGEDVREAVIRFCVWSTRTQ